MDLEPAGRFEWERIICRARLGATVQHVALLLAVHADGSGENVRPGIRRLAAIAGYDVRTIKRVIVKLRDLGLIERVYEASRSGRKGMADEYRLTIPDDLLEHVELISPDTDQGTAQSPALPGYPQPGDTRVPWTPCQPGDTDGGAGDTPVPNQVTPLSPHQYITPTTSPATSRYLTSPVPVESANGSAPVENPDPSSAAEEARPDGLSDEQWDEIKWLSDAQKRLTAAKANSI